jgi:hypothetical protein
MRPVIHQQVVTPQFIIAEHGCLATIATSTVTTEASTKLAQRRFALTAAVTSFCE